MNEKLSLLSDNPLALEQRVIKRNRQSSFWQRVYLSATVVGILALAALLYTILNDTFGYVILVNKVEPTELTNSPLEDITQTELVAILKKQLSKGEVSRLDKEIPLENRSTDDLKALFIEKVIQPKVIENYTLMESIFKRGEINNKLLVTPNGNLVFRSWFNKTLLIRSMSNRPETAGIRTALYGSLWMILITILFAFPVGVGAAIYLEEYASNSRINKLIQINIDNLAGVPSIVYGILGLAIFVRAFLFITSGQFFGVEGGNGRTLLSAGLTMGLLVLPLIIINTQEALRSVPLTLKQASYGLGATQWQTIWHHVLPYAMPGILTGTILAISRAIGETAPLIIVGAATLITKDPSGPFSQFTVLPIQIYNWITRPQQAYHHLAAAAILVLLISLLSINAVAILLRNRYSRRNS